MRVEHQQGLRYKTWHQFHQHFWQKGPSCQQIAEKIRTLCAENLWSFFSWMTKKLLFAGCHTAKKASKIFCAQSSNFFGNLLTTWSFSPKMLMKLTPGKLNRQYLVSKVEHSWQKCQHTLSDVIVVASKEFELSQNIVAIIPLRKLPGLRTCSVDKVLWTML